MRKIISIFVVLLAALAIAFIVGPSTMFEPVASPEIAPMNLSLAEVDQYVITREEHIKGLKPDNQSRIIWADSLRKTRYSLVYLHGFSASPMEGQPVHVDVAKRYGMNLYLPLLSGHGIDDENSFRDLTPGQLVEDAKEAIAIGQLIGEEVIVMACSTGGTLAVYLAGANKDMIKGLIMYSPNIELYDQTAKLITGPWGAQILRAAAGTHRDYGQDGPPETQKYWTTKYRNEGLIALQSLLDQTMTDEVFQSIDQPYFLGYYYKNDEEQDKTVSVAAMKAFDAKTSTPSTEKRVMSFPDAGAHVIANPLKSESAGKVESATFNFLEEVLHIVPVSKESDTRLTADRKKELIFQE